MRYIKFREGRLKYNNFGKKLLRTTKRLYISNLDIKKVIDNRSFWKTIYLLFSTKGSKCDKIILNENDKFVSNDDKQCQIVGGYFSNIISDLQISLFSKKKLKHGWYNEIEI